MASVWDLFVVCCGECVGECVGAFSLNHAAGKGRGRFGLADIDCGEAKHEEPGTKSKRGPPKKGKKDKKEKGKVKNNVLKNPKRKVVRAIVQKYCVLCLYWSESEDPRAPGTVLKWGHPRHDKGVEGSVCYYCRRTHRAKASLQCCM
jgi:hypothetical protein